MRYTAICGFDNKCCPYLEDDVSKCTKCARNPKNKPKTLEGFG